MRNRLGDMVGKDTTLVSKPSSLALRPGLWLFEYPHGEWRGILLGRHTLPPSEIAGADLSGVGPIPGSLEKHSLNYRERTQKLRTDEKQSYGAKKAGSTISIEFLGETETPRLGKAEAM